MSKRWQENVGIGLLATSIGYALLFGLSSVVTVYDDHKDVMGRWSAVVNEKNKLKEILEKREQHIEE
jgi:hypothetical protein